MRIQWRDQYDDARDAEERRLTDIVNDDPSMTQQGLAADTDINTIVKRFRLGEIPMPEPLGPEYYADIANLPDLRAILEYQRDYKNQFMDLPAEIRTRFRNDPAEMWDFVANPHNAAEAIRLGILKDTTPPADTPPLTDGDRSASTAEKPENAGGKIPPDPPKQPQTKHT